MKIKPIRSIRDLLSQLPEGVLADADKQTLRDLNGTIKTLQTPHEAGAVANLFPNEQRMAIASALRDGIADIIEARIAIARREKWKADVEAAKAPKADGRRIDPAIAAARADKARAVLDVQAFKSRIKGLDDALAAAVAAAKNVLEPEGSQPDNERRRRVMEPAARRAVEAAQALHAAATGGAADFSTDTKEIAEQSLPSFERMCEKWITKTLPATKDFMPAKFAVTVNLLVTLRSLTRDATERIRELKA